MIMELFDFGFFNESHFSYAWLYVTKIASTEIKTISLNSPLQYILSLLFSAFSDLFCSN